MNERELREKLLELNHNPLWYKELNEDEINYLIEVTSFLPIDSDLSLRRYHFWNNLKEQKVCPICKKPLDFKNIRKTFCSNECKKSKEGKLFTLQQREKSNLEKYGVANTFYSKELREKGKQTCLEKYGVENVSQSETIKKKKAETTKKHYGVDIPLQSTEIKNKFKQTCLEKYGVESPLQNKDVKNKVKQTNLRKYGVESPLQLEENREKAKNVCLEKYGVEYAIISDEIRDKIKQTCLGKYGVENALMIKEIRDKGKDVCLEKYGTIFPSQNDDIKNKFKQTCLEKYGVENPFQSKEVKEKIQMNNVTKYGVKNVMQNNEIFKRQKETMLNRYGVEHTVYSKELLTKKKHTFRKHYAPTFFNVIKQKNLEPLFTMDDYINVNDSKLKFKCERCGMEFEVNNYTINRRINCPNQIHKQSSQYEQEIYDWLLSLGITNIERNKRNWNVRGKIYEADLYLPDYNLAIEYNGLYWHSNLFKKDDYHFNKWKFFKGLGIDCIQIFENEWWNKKDIIKSIIMNRLGLNTKTNITDIKTIDSELFKQFIDSNYIFDYIDSEYKLGMFVNDELVSVIGLSKGKKYDWIVDSFCIKIGYELDDYNSLISFLNNNFGNKILFKLDNRYFNGNGYTNNGFIHIGHTKPNYFYFKRNDDILHNRMEFQKHKLKDKLDSFDEELSEKDNMTMNDYLWIYDCGNEIYSIK